MFNRNVYECALYSITPDIRVNRDCSKKDNIANCDTKFVMSIMVSPTFRKNFYREIITGMLIPVYRHTYKFGFTHPFGNEYFSIPSQPVFIEIYEEYYFGEHTEYNIEVASDKDIRNYIEKHKSNPDGFKRELYEIFKRAEEYYEQAYIKNEYSTEYQVKSLRKTMK